ncbi:hypothetical protein [uncultured Psychroserpens sp.]|uniref:hypothetical protein n=1 Tax=uncultured Psychroserpens sp. TaxID=255436 RepID=UPI002636B93A|nr:hypothetical protein [uncultured Psychroserpens sp.]
MRKSLLLILIAFSILCCNDKKKTEPLTFEQAKLELADYSEEDQEKEYEFLKKNIFNGLKNLNDGFDAESIYYFSESDFEIVLNRIEKNGIAIYGIEPWFDGDYYGVKVAEEYNSLATNPNWYRKAFSEFKKSGKGLMYAASYGVPKELFEE